MDSNVPIKTGNVPRSVSPSPSDPGSRPRSRSFTPDKYLQAPTGKQADSNDVENLLSSPAPGRPRSASFRGRPPPSAVRKVAAALRSRSRSGSRSQSPANGASRREISPEHLHLEGWREEHWKFALENAVDDMVSSQGYSS